MPKKSRRAKTKRQQRAARQEERTAPRESRAVLEQASTATSESPAETPTIRSGSAPAQEHVVTELKQIGIFAGGILLTLVVLSFVLG